VLNRTHSITADIELTKGAEGVLLCQGAAAGGYTFFVQNRRLHYVHNFLSREEFAVDSDVDLPDSGRHQLRFEFEPTGDMDLLTGHGAPGIMQLYVDGKLVGANKAPYTIPIAINPGALTCGANPGSSVTPRYRAPFGFTGTIHSVTVDVSGELITDNEAEMRMHMARQ
jgi:arylsulfatase